MHHARREDVTEFGSPTSGEVQAQAARSVTLLNAIEGAITRASANAQMLNTIACELLAATKGLATIPNGTALDPEGRARVLLDLAAAAAKRLHETASGKRESARADTRLTKDDGVEAAYGDFASAAMAVFDAAESYREHLDTLDAMSSPRGDKIYTETDDMMADILAGN